MFAPATKKQLKLRMALAGPSGSGKTYTALRIAHALADGGKIAVVDTENGSASKYVGEEVDGITWAFDAAELADDFHPKRFVELIKYAEANGYEVLVIDGLTPAWSGKNGMLDQVDRLAARSKSGSGFNGWRDAKPIEREFWDALIHCKVHLICTLRVKTEYVVEEDQRGRRVPRKVGLAPQQRGDLEYEFDIVGDLDHDNRMTIAKTRCSALAGQVIGEPGAELAATVKAWLSDGLRIPDDAISPDHVRSVIKKLGPHHDAVVQQLGKPVVTWTMADVDAAKPIVEALRAKTEPPADDDRRPADDTHTTDTFQGAP